jgi:hypothetical protein
MTSNKKSEIYAPLSRFAFLAGLVQVGDPSLEVRNERCANDRKFQAL